MSEAVAILTSFILVCHFTDKWLLSKGNLFWVYIFSICSSTLTIGLNVLLVMLHKDQRGLLLFVANSTWTIAMCARGLMRLRKERRNEARGSIKDRGVAMEGTS